MPTLVTVGHVTHDEYGPRLLPGGSVYYAGLTWRALGGEARIITAMGEDFEAHDSLAGVEVQARRGAETTRFFNHYPHGPQTGDRVQIIAAQAQPVRPAPLPQPWRDPDVVFLAPVLDEVDLNAWRHALSGRHVALGLQGWLKAKAPPTDVPGQHRVVRSDWPGGPERLRSLMQGVDLVFLSDEDIAGDSTLLEGLVVHVPTVVLTLGAHGCRIYQGSQIASVGVFKARADSSSGPTVVDPTGAGDCFAAAFLYAIAQGSDVIDAAQLGAAAASIVIEAPAGGALPLVSAAFERARRVPVA